MIKKLIWRYLLEKTGNEYGTAAIMGNLMAESSMNPKCATGKKKTPNYTEDADSGAVDFKNDGVAYGLAQWCYHTRKAALRDLATLRGASVGSLDLQMEYLWMEMSEKYKTVWNAVCNATNVREASDIVMLKYEKPANTGEAAKQKRAIYGQMYYDQFAEGKKADPSENKTVRATVPVNIRAGKGTSTEKVGVLKKGKSLEWIATEDGWHKVAVWISGDFSEVKG